MKIVRYRSQTILRGRLTTEFHLGRPGYGESPELDELERPSILILDDPVTVLDEDTGDPEDIYSHGRDSVDRVQMVWRKKGPADVDVLGHGVEVEGELWPSHTGHHHTALLMDVSEVRTIDDRDTFRSGAITGRGTGLLLGESGIVLTNAHVVRHGKGITVTRGLHRSVAQIRHFDPRLDLALLTVTSMTAPAVNVRTWMGPQLGERIFAFGFPLRPILSHSLNPTFPRWPADPATVAEG
jgi:S1-C subfamily serine protease